MDLTNITATKVAPTPSGLDPEIERLADEYARKTWVFDMEPVLKMLYPKDMDSEDFVALAQETLFQHKYKVLEESKLKKETNKKIGKRW